MVIYKVVAYEKWSLWGSWLYIYCPCKRLIDIYAQGEADVTLGALVPPTVYEAMDGTYKKAFV